MPKLLAHDEVERSLETLEGWELAGKSIRRTFVFSDFIAGVEFVNSVAEAAEEMDHHPDIDIRYNKVTLTLSTHKKGGLTSLDFALARRIDDLPEP